MKKHLVETLSDTAVIYTDTRPGRSLIERPKEGEIVPHFEAVDRVEIIRMNDNKEARMITIYKHEIDAINKKIKEIESVSFDLVFKDLPW